MAKTKISEYDSTAANNTDIDGINIAEGCPPSGLNNALREQMSHLKDGLGAGTPVFLDQTNNRLGVGTTNADTPLTIQPSAQGVGTNAVQSWMYGLTSGSEFDLKLNQVVSSGLVKYAFNLRNNGTSYNNNLVLDRGNVGIGTNSPSETLHVKGGTGDHYKVRLEDSSGNTGLKFGQFGTNGQISSPSALEFCTGTSDTERMRIDGSGNLLVGKTTTSFSTAGSRLKPDGGGQFVVSGGACVEMNRLSLDGTMMLFQKDGSTVGSIGANSSSAYFVGTAHGLIMHSGDVRPCTNTGANDDNSLDLGASFARFDDVFATNGTIQTSDENEKQDIASLTSAEITAATAISKLFKTYKWKDKVAAKGDDARTHTGVVAQQVQTAMSDAGLDASKYAFWCSNTWWETQTEVAAVKAVEAKDAVYDDDGKLVSEAVEGVEAKDAYTRTDHYDTKDEAPEGATERTRLGVRYPELLAFVGAATEQRLTSIESRLDALEG